jgi:DNA-directed RNA polymerase alpha subunit
MLLCNMDVHTSHETTHELVLQIANTYPHIVEAVRHTLLSRCPTMRFEHACFDTVSAGIELEDVLSMQVGQIPVNVDANQFCFENEVSSGRDSHDIPQLMSDDRVPWMRPYERHSEKNGELGHGIASRPGRPVHGTVHAELPIQAHPQAHLIFSIDVHCELNKAGSGLENQEVYSRHLTWVPLEGQTAKFAATNSPQWFYPDIHLATLCAGQRIKALFFVCKGEGYEHSKWKAADASYRIVPTMYTNNDVVNAAVASARAAKRLVDLEEIGDYALKVIAACPVRILRALPESNHIDSPGYGEVRLNNAQACTLCMQCQDVAVPRSIKVPLIEFDPEEKDYELKVSTPLGGPPARRMLYQSLQLLSRLFSRLESSLQHSLKQLNDGELHVCMVQDEWVVKKVAAEDGLRYAPLDSSEDCILTVKAADHVVKRCLEHELLQLQRVVHVSVCNNPAVDGVDFSVQTTPGFSAAQALVAACAAASTTFANLQTAVERQFRPV